MALRAVIFDLDGTLLDTNGLHSRAWADVLAEAGHTIPEERVALEIGKGGDRLVPTLVGETVEREQGEALRTAHGERYRALVASEGVRVFPEAAAIFEAVRERGLRTAVATASKEENLEHVLEQAGLQLYDLADAIVTDSDVENSKPAPDVVLAAAAKLGLPPAACAMVGDTPYDAIAARQAGVVLLGVLTGVHDAAAMHRAGARAVFSDIADLHARLDDALRLASPGTTAPTDALFERLMDAAIEEARAGLAADELPVGAVLARSDGTIVARGRNEARARSSRTAHAEMMAFRAAEETDLAAMDDLLLVSTLEPCVMCLGAAMTARLDTVVYGLDAPPNGGTGRCTPLDAPGALPLRVVGGVRADESRSLLEQWRARHPEDAFVRDLLDAATR